MRTIGSKELVSAVVVVHRRIGVAVVVKVTLLGAGERIIAAYAVALVDVL